MKTLFLITSLEQGGIETYLLRYLEYFQEHEAIVICKSGGLGELYPQYTQMVRVIPMYFSYFGGVRYYRYYKLLKREQVDTVCDFTGNFAGLPLLVAWFARVKKRIVFYRGSTNHFRETRIRLLYNACMRKLVSVFATKILSNSVAALDFFFPKRDRTSDRFDVIYNGMDMKKLSKLEKKRLRQEFGLPSDAFVVGHTGRCNEAKNHDTILKVASELCHKYKDIHFVLVGKGVKEKYEMMVQQMGLNKQIHLLGYRDDVLRILPLFDLYYFPPLTEGQPNALIEAMATGLPFVASDIAPIKESVPPAIRSLLLPPCDSERAVKVIERIYKGESDGAEYMCKEWAQQHFDADELFAKFRREL